MTPKKYFFLFSGRCSLNRTWNNTEWMLFTCIKSGARSRIFVHVVNVILADCFANTWLTWYQKIIQITTSGIIRSGMTVFSFKPNRPIMNNKNTIIDTIILQQANNNSKFIYSSWIVFGNTDSKCSLFCSSFTTFLRRHLAHSISCVTCN